MAEDVGEIYYSDQKLRPYNQDNYTVQSPLPLEVITIADGSMRETPNDEVMSQQEAWLPITESRNGNICTSVFHLLSSGIGLQLLLLPLAFSILGWSWGILSLSLGFAWQLYTMWLLVQLHETVPGSRCSRYLQLSSLAFGPKIGKLLAIFPVMYLSGGACVLLIITGGKTMELFFITVCSKGASCDAKSLAGIEWFLIFTCIAIIFAQRPNLNSISGISLIAGITAIGYCTLIWVFAISKGRPNGTSYSSSLIRKSHMGKVSDILNALGMTALSFRGHNLVLEIQGTFPSSSKLPSSKPMWKGVLISYILIAICLFPMAIVGFWAYGNKIPTKVGNLSILLQFYSYKASNFLESLIYLLVVINSLSSFQIYAMLVFDNLELRYTSIKKKRCSLWVRTSLRLLFGGLAYFLAIAFPFLPSLAALIGGMALPLTFVYPCFMWISIKKPRRISSMWCLNMGLGCLGLIFCVLLVMAAVWNLATKGLDANFFKP